MLEIINGDLFDAKEKYLLHQCNCVTNRAAHLAKDVFDKYPYADVYSGRAIESVPGTIDIRGNGADQRYVINMFGQYYPGGPKYPLSAKDGTTIREKYFHKCLLKVAQIPDLESVALPWRVGCGAAMGNWDHYLGTITNFANFVYEKFNTKVVIYRKDNAE